METALSYTDPLIIQLAIAVVLLPFAAFLINFLLISKTSKVSGWISSLAILLSFILSAIVFFKVWDKPHDIHVQQVWFAIGNVKVQIGLWLNNLSVLMLLLVPAVALPVHIYSIAYMAGDAKYTRYFTYLSFFCFAMLALVVMDNMLLMYAFWELVGFASYLLIGFWFTRDKAVQANKKAFIMNRIGDIALLVGILMLYAHYHTFDMVKLFAGDNALANAQGVDKAWLTIPGICFLCGAIAKSAQFPLHTWLPDAMEGPTSVSALIHAATMVAAGIFLLGRVYPAFNADVLTVIAVIGCFTAFMAATIALTQNDLKRILAYSTISQLGFMMLAMGVGAYSSALFHLATHAFFKCLLFLSAGVIIHEMQHLKQKHQLNIDPQNILYMGGLRKLMPVTFITCSIAALALIGLPLTSGYLSKDGILIQAFEWAEGKGWLYSIIPIGAMLTSLLTAFYVARLMFKVFFGESRLKEFNPDIVPEAHDGSLLYQIPMMMLAACCLFPLFSFNPFFYEQAWLFKGFIASSYLERMNLYHTVVPVAVNLLIVPVIYLAYATYIKRDAHWFKQQGVLFRFSYNQWYIDSFYNKVIVKLVLLLSNLTYWLDKNVIDGLIGILANIGILLGKIAAWVDEYVIDGILHVITGIVKQGGNFVRGFQTGRVQGYLVTMLLVILVLYVLKTFI